MSVLAAVSFDLSNFGDFPWQDKAQTLLLLICPDTIAVSDSKIKTIFSKITTKIKNLSKNINKGGNGRVRVIGVNLLTLRGQIK